MNESVSYHIEASCLIAQISVPSLELVETAPRMMSSTPRGMGRGQAGLYYVFSESFSGLDIWDCIGLHCTFILQFWQRNRTGFAALFGILVALFFDGVLLYVFVSFTEFLCVSFPFSFLLKLNKSVLKVESNSLLYSAFSFV